MLPSTTMIGSLSVTPVLDSVVCPPAGALYSNTPAAMWAAHPGMLTATGAVEMFQGGYLVCSGDRVVLVDAGVGPDGWRAPSGAFIPGGYLLDSLRVAGIEPSSVTDVVLTHLHPDHIGWVGRDGMPNFPRATYRCHRRDWAFFVEQELADATSRVLLAPLVDHFEMFDGPGTLFAGCDLIETPGHTPGSTTIVLSSGDGSRAVLLGDVVHCPVELVDEEWETVADVDPVLAMQTRVRLLRELEGTDTVIGAAHFPALRFGRLLESPTGRRWQALS